MKNYSHHLTWLSFASLAVSAAAQTAPPATPSAGLLNDYLRKQSSALESWDIGGQVRARFEAKNGYAVPGAGAAAVDFSRSTPDNNYWLLREKIHLGWTPDSWLKFYVEGRDSSSHDDKRTPEPEEDSLDLHQAWIGLGDAKQFPITAKIGRQEFIYGDERFLGAGDWTNIGRVHDAARVRFENPDVLIDAFAGRPVLANDGEFNVSNDYEWLSGVYASTRTLIPKQETQLYFLSRNTGQQSPIATTGVPQAGGVSARDIYTLGLRVKSLPGQFAGWDYSAELAGQLGNYYEPALKARLDHAAVAAHVGGGYTFSELPATPRVGLEYNYASGDSDPTDSEHGTFDNLFPTNHKFYGLMDFFSLQNVHDPRLSLSAKPLKGLTLTADYHLFWLADTSDLFYGVTGAGRRTGGYGVTPTADRFVGSEIDLVASYAVKTLGTLQVGYGHFFRGDYVKDSLPLAQSKDANWFYLQAVFNF